MTHYNDLERLKTVYKRRDIGLQERDVYASLNIAYLFMVQQRERATVRLMQTLGLHSFAGVNVLEVGCGRGDVLQQLMFHRLKAHQLHGVELIPDRLKDTKQRFPGANLIIADGQKVPYADNRFELVVQHTVFSSILDSAIKTNIASEMLRVLKRPHGVILWYDFLLNPTNPETRGIRKQEVKRLFPSCNFVFRRVTLAPPLARKLVPISWTLSLMLEKLKLFNTHYLVAIQPNSDSPDFDRARSGISHDPIAR